MAVTTSIVNQLEQQTITLTLSADEDIYELDLGNARLLGMDSQNSITADEIEVYLSADTDPSYTPYVLAGAAFDKGEYSKYANNLGVAPFDAANDDIAGIDIAGQKKMLVRRSGSADGTLKFIINLSR